MKVYIGSYTDYLGLYQLVKPLRKIGLSEERCDKIADWLDKTWPGKVLQKFNRQRERKIKIKLHDYDVWNMDSTLAYIILPLLRKLKDVKHGSPGDLIEFQQTSNSVQFCFDFYQDGDELAWKKGHEHWEAILDKIIWSFEQLNTDWEDQFHSGEHDIYFEKIEGTEYSAMKRGPKDTHKFDAEGYNKFQAKMQEGFELFGKYYRNLWT